MSCISCIKMKDVTLPRPLFKSAADNKSSGGQCCQEAAGWRPSDRQSQWFVRSHAGCNSPSNQTAVNTPRRAPTAGALHFSVQTAAQSEEACWYLYCLFVWIWAQCPWCVSVWKSCLFVAFSSFSSCDSDLQWSPFIFRLRPRHQPKLKPVLFCTFSNQ